MKNEFQPVVGHGFQFRSTPVQGWDGIIESKVLAVEPKTKLSYRWDSMGLESVVTFTLTPTEGGTNLRMEHAGFRSEEDMAYKGAKYGWQGFLGKLDKLAEEL